MNATIEIPLSRGKVALIDAADAELVTPYKWHAVYQFHNWYARRNIRINGRRTTICLHRVLMAGSLPPGFAVDHINGNGLDNRRCNLRAASRTQNRANQHRVTASSGMKGVYWHSRDHVWQSLIGDRYLGQFKTKEEAQAAYIAAARELYGDYAYIGEGC